MSELRHDPLSGHDVIVAAGRAARPVTFDRSAEQDSEGLRPECPFCPGSEAMTPPEVARAGPGDPDTPGWEVRVVPNLYPIVDGTDDGSGASGVHEVVVLSPDHRSFAQLDDREAVQVVTVLRDRVRTHLAAGHAFAFAILNHLRGAGASIAHPHAQVFALDRVPRAVEAALERTCLAHHDLVAADAADPSYLVTDAPASLWCPRASPSPYFMRVAHSAAGACFHDADDDVLAAVAVSVRDAVRRLAAALGDVPYNVVVHTAPPARAPFHWYVDVVPRVSIVAGFELATGILVNSAPPEQAAAALRDTKT